MQAQWIAKSKPFSRQVSNGLGRTVTGLRRDLTGSFGRAVIGSWKSYDGSEPADPGLKIARLPVGVCGERIRLAAPFSGLCTLGSQWQDHKPRPAQDPASANGRTLAGPLLVHVPSVSKRCHRNDSALRSLPLRKHTAGLIAVLRMVMLKRHQ